MADVAAQLVDRVLPEVPIRQWVLTLLRAFIHALFAELRRRARRQWVSSSFRGRVGRPSESAQLS